MKPRSIQKLFAFIIVMMFSISYLNAQCSGNKVQMFKPKLHGLCISKCVPPSQVERYVSNGWWYWCYVNSSAAIKTTPKRKPNKIADNAATLAKK